MAYELSSRLFLENGPAQTLEHARRRSSSTNFNLIWARLPAKERAALIDRFLKAA